MENKMAEVAKLLGVELGEEFGLKNSNFRYKLTTYGLRKRHITIEEWVNSSILDDLLLGKVEIVKKAKSILDAAEKRYLSAVIKPFRDKVISITKFTEICEDVDFIEIKVEQSCYYEEFIDLPYFKRGTMYQGMEVDKPYTIHELGL